MNEPLDHAHERKRQDDNHQVDKSEVGDQQPGNEGDTQTGQDDVGRPVAEIRAGDVRERVKVGCLLLASTVVLHKCHVPVLTHLLVVDQSRSALQPPA